MPAFREIQLGKNKITDNFIFSLKNQFKNCQNVKISVLKSARENKEDVKKLSSEILNKLGDNYSARIVGYTIALKKLKKSKE